MNRWVSAATKIQIGERKRLIKVPANHIVIRGFVKGHEAKEHDLCLMSKHTTISIVPVNEKDYGKMAGDFQHGMLLRPVTEEEYRKYERMY